MKMLETKAGSLICVGIFTYCLLYIAYYIFPIPYCFSVASVWPKVALGRAEEGVANIKAGAPMKEKEQELLKLSEKAGSHHVTKQILLRCSHAAAADCNE